MAEEPRNIEQLEAKLIYSLNLLNELIKRTLSYQTHPKTKALEIERLLQKGVMMISMYKARTTYSITMRTHDKG